MLYYIIKFIKLVLRKPRKMALYYRRLRREWEDDCTSRQLNQVVYVSTNNWRMCYGAQNYSPYIIEHIAMARYSIDIAMFFIGLDPIMLALKNAHNRGVRVRLICEKNVAYIKENYGKYINIRRIETSSGTTSRYTTMHHKFCIIDGYRSKKEFHKGKSEPIPLTIVMTGSINWGSQIKNYEDLLITSSPKMAKRLEDEFERMWRSRDITII